MSSSQVDVQDQNQDQESHVDLEALRQRLKDAGQEHLLRWYEELDARSRERLVKEIENVNFAAVENLKRISRQSLSASQGPSFTSQTPS